MHLEYKGVSAERTLESFFLRRRSARAPPAHLSQRTRRCRSLLDGDVQIGVEYGADRVITVNALCERNALEHDSGLAVPLQGRDGLRERSELLLDQEPGYDSTSLPQRGHVDERLAANGFGAAPPDH